MLDVYQEMFGPCISLQITLEQYKVSYFQNFIVMAKFREWETFYILIFLLFLQLNWSHYKTCSARNTIWLKKIFFSVFDFQVSLSDSDSLQLATCNADKIEKLKRFRGKSLPTILFCKVSTVSYLQIESRIIKIFFIPLGAFRNFEMGEETKMNFFSTFIKI